MSLSPGTRLGPYEIQQRIGAGGMGEVYRAHDTALDRSVAIKVLPDAVARDPERLARFAREARTLAALNDPHIAQVYGFEQADSMCALAMELVDGEELAATIARGPIPWIEAKPMAMQIAQALEAAHQQGIVHRDLKPANIRIRPDGAVKVLDFGLAKALTEGPSRRQTGQSDEHANGPTITSPALMTHAGVILGTAAYMSPEQAKGHVVDKRSDIWAFGCVLYEMLTGRRAFAGDDVVETLAAIVRAEPDYSLIPDDVPAPVRDVLVRCLKKDRRSRLSDIAVVRYVFESTQALESTQTQNAATAGSRWREIALASILFAVAAVAFAVTQLGRDIPDAPALVQRFSIVTPQGAAIQGDAYVRSSEIAISPDGSRVVYVPVQSGDEARLIVRALDRFDTTTLSKVGRGVSAPFFSPDGEWVGYQTAAANAQNMLAKIPILGGAPVNIVEIVGDLRGASWGADDQIVFATTFSGAGLYRTRAVAGATAETLTVPNAADGETDHLWPDILPDGKHVLFTITRQGPDASDVALLSLETGKWQVLVQGGSQPRYVASGHIVYAAPGALRAVGFDLKTLRVTTESQQVLDGVRTKARGAADFALAENGTLIYLPGSETFPLARLSWVTPSGSKVPIDVDPGSYGQGALSPDGRFVAVEITDTSGTGILVIDLEREASSRVTPTNLVARNPVWSPDGRWIAFSAERQGDEAAGLFRVAANGAGQPERITTAAEARQVLEEWSPDGKHLFFVLTATGSGIEGPAIHRVSATPGANDVERIAEWTAEPRVSPNGKWLAHISLRGSPQVGLHLRPLADWDSARVVVSPSGQTPLWRRDGRELYYQDGSAVFGVTIDESSEVTVGKPRMLFDRPERLFGVSPDGARFLIAERASDPARSQLTEIRVVTNWREELKATRFAARVN